MLKTDAVIEVVGMAGDGEEALSRIRELRPDVVTLDVQMPRMGGLEALERIMSEQPVPVLLLSSLTQEGGDITLRGLELGAMDFVDKSSAKGSMNLLSLAEELKAKVHALAGVPLERVRARLPLRQRPRAAPTVRRQVDLIVIAASTGGPTALQAVIPRLPDGLQSAVLVVQHMPAGFTRSLAERLDSRSALPVREAEDGDLVTPGTVLLAPGGRHLKLRRRGSRVKVWLDDEPRSALHRPSADVAMAAVARIYAARSVGVVLTGMGSDGTEGLKAIRAAGGTTLAEREDTCIIYGMPKSAVEAGVVDKTVPLPRMADEILGAL
jgi:two-component system chemotaxis response regulator CheB